MSSASKRSDDSRSSVAAQRPLSPSATAASPAPAHAIAPPTPTAAAPGERPASSQTAASFGSVSVLGSSGGGGELRPGTAPGAAGALSPATHAARLRRIATQARDNTRTSGMARRVERCEDDLTQYLRAIRCVPAAPVMQQPMDLNTSMPERILKVSAECSVMYQKIGRQGTLFFLVCWSHDVAS